MITQKTTSQIKEISENLVKYNLSLENNKEWLNFQNVVWLCRDDVIREIERRRSNVRCSFYEKGEKKGEFKALNDLYYDLCNSQEQKNSIQEHKRNSDCAGMEGSNPSTIQNNSVFCEHNTGEVENHISDKEQISVASPVHSRKWCCEHRPDAHNENGCKSPLCVCKSKTGYKEESSPVLIPKKCTCLRPEPRLPEELFNNKCGRCGGVF